MTKISYVAGWALLLAACGTDANDTSDPAQSSGTTLGPCANQQIARYDEALGWTCGEDHDTTYNEGQAGAIGSSMLASMSCDVNGILQYDGSSWGCFDPLVVDVPTQLHGPVSVVTSSDLYPNTPTWDDCHLVVGAAGNGGGGISYNQTDVNV